MNYHIGQGDTFDMDSLIPIRKISFFQRLMIRLSFIFYVPRLLIRLASIKREKHVLNDG